MAVTMTGPMFNYSEARRGLKALMDAAISDRVAITITRSRSEPVVMIAKSEYDALVEMLHLVRSPRNAERLREAIAETTAGKRINAKLVDGEIHEAP